MKIKPAPLADHAAFLSLIHELAALEVELRSAEAARDARLAAIAAECEAPLAPLRARLQGGAALAAAYARDHRAALLPAGARSVRTPFATYGWRTGNRAVALLPRCTPASAVARLKRAGLARFVRTREELARDALLAACRNGKTITLPPAPGRRARHLALARAGLRITQGESFYIEPHASETTALKLPAAA